jgi:hypothetical protein
MIGPRRVSRRIAAYVVMKHDGRMTAGGTAATGAMARAAMPFPGKATLVEQAQRGAPPVPAPAAPGTLAPGTPPPTTATGDTAHGTPPPTTATATGDLARRRADAHPLHASPAHAPIANAATTAPQAQMRSVMAPAVAALRALGTVKPTLLPQAFPAAAAALGGARDRARDLVADQAQPPPTPAFVATPPARSQPAAPQRALHRHAPIEHARTAGQADTPRTPDQVSAGPRPRVPLTGAADPVAADAHHQTTHHTLAAQLQDADRAAQRDFGIERIPAPAPPGERRPPPALGDAIAVPALRPGRADPELDALLAPKVADKIQAAATGAQAVAAQSEAHAARFTAQRQAAAQHQADEQARLRSDAARRGEALRGQWHQANAQLHNEHTALIAQQHAHTMTTVQSSVLHTEQTTGQRLTDAESAGSRELATARSRADAIRAAHPRGGDPHHDQGGGGSGEADAQQVLDAAQQLVEQMLTAARQHNAAEVERLRQQVAALLAAHATQLQSFIEVTLAKFPLIGKFYQQQIDDLMTMVQTDSARIAGGGPNDGALAVWTDQLTHDLGLMKRYLGEVETIASYDGDIDKLRAAFGITFNKNDKNGDKWSHKVKGTDDTYEEVALLGAISTEHAFRRSATAGQMDDVDFGKGFQSVFGQMNMTYNPTQPYLYTVKQGSDGLWYTYDSDGNAQQKPGKGYATQADASGHRGPYGAETMGAHEIEFYDIAFAAGDKDPDKLLFNVIHEFGHAFNVNARGRGYGALGSDVIEAMVDGKKTKIAGKGVDRHTDEKYGMKDYPYQEDKKHTDGEEFADMFLNWVENSFADNDAGRARFSWMNQHMWGDTTLRGVEGEKQWGWIDTAIDHNSGSSQWVADSKTAGHYQVQPGDTLQSIADKLKIKDPSTLQQANNMGDSTDLSKFPVLLIPGMTDAQIAKAIKGR